MGKQFNRLLCEQLKEYYLKNFDDFRNMGVVIVDLIHQKGKLVIGLYDELREKSAEIITSQDIVERTILEDELHQIFDERNLLRTEEAKKRDEFYKPPDPTKAYQIDKIRADVLEKKLDLIEEKLNSMGVFIKITDGKVVFSDKG